MTSKKLGKIMVQGLVAVLPALLTIYILYWSVWSAETILGNILKLLLPPGWYIPGMGLLAGAIGVLLFGFALNAFLVQRLLDWGEEALNRIPLIKTLYGPAKDFVGFFSAGKERGLSQVVTVELRCGEVPMRMIGFVTRNDFEGLPPGIGGEGEIVVYIPTSYNIGGHTVIMPRSAVKPVDISAHRAMGFVVTAGMFTEKGHTHRKLHHEERAKPASGHDGGNKPVLP